MKKMFVFAAITLFSLYLILSGSGCSTMEGLGKDIQTMGEGLSDVAKE